MSGTDEHVSLGDAAAGRAGVAGVHRLVGSVVGERADGDVYETLRAATLEVIRERQLAPDDHPAVRAVIVERIEDYQRRAGSGTAGPRLKDPSQVAGRLFRSITSYGPFDRYLHDPERADEVIFKGRTLSAFRRDGRLEVDDQPTSEAELRHSVERMLTAVGASLDLETPIQVQHVLGKAARLSVSIPPLADALDGSLRIFRVMRTQLDELVEWEGLTFPAAQLLTAFAHTPQVGILFSGPPSSGKTTALAATLKAVPPTLITRIVQEVRELDTGFLPGGCWSPAGSYDLRALVRRSLQFAPGLLIVSETLGSEAFELLKAANSGCSMWTTLHAASASMALQSLVTAALMAGANIPERLVRSTFARLINLVVHCDVMPVHLVRPGERRLRQVMEICVVPPQITTDEFTVEPLGGPLEYTGGPIPEALERRLNRALPPGMTVRGLCEGKDRLS